MKPSRLDRANRGSTAAGAGLWLPLALVLSGAGLIITLVVMQVVADMSAPPAEADVPTVASALVAAYGAPAGVSVPPVVVTVERDGSDDPLLRQASLDQEAASPTPYAGPDQPTAQPTFNPYPDGTPTPTPEGANPTDTPSNGGGGGGGSNATNTPTVTGTLTTTPDAEPTVTPTLTNTVLPATLQPPTPTQNVQADRRLDCGLNQPTVLRGTNAPPTSPLVILFEEIPVGGGYTDARGAYAATLIVTQEEPGEYLVEVRLRETYQLLNEWLCVVPAPTPRLRP